MFQPNLFQPASVSVTDLTRYLRRLLESDESLQDIWVIGEISNLSRPASGHIYFTLKDAGAALRCVVWKSAAPRMRMALQNGFAVEVHGAISLYERDGSYQLYVDAARPAGEGLLFQEFLRLKARLEAEGLFEEARKRPIPARPRRIGIVTSPTGAALQDMLNTLARRYPLAEVVLAPAMVQGEEAPASLCAALEALNRYVHPDVIIIARGGGSLEDLWAFNDEWLVRAVAASLAPVISGVGHETDFTLCDFAADLRAPTPTGAAVAAVPEIEELLGELNLAYGQLAGAFENVLDGCRANLSTVQSRLEFASPLRRVQNEQQRVDMLALRGERAFQHRIELMRVHLRGAQSRLAALSPLAVLERGYAVVSDSQGRLVRSVDQVRPGQQVKVRLSDGHLTAEVQHTEKQPGT